MKQNLDGQARIQSIQAITATAVVPEPASVVLLWIGAIMTAWYKRRQ
ncbi:PEP-CTERM sorting domain-containing protein [Candidatus Desantisbacteria bacterium]|nr:PEP-CTERM sorting domain-containing protein [Candidatus Desantisbacteria bacterium]